jgi:hypothetical protein
MNDFMNILPTKSIPGDGEVVKRHDGYVDVAAGRWAITGRGGAPEKVGAPADAP